MKDDSVLDLRIRRLLRDALDQEVGPDRTWADSPAARRIGALDRNSRNRWPLRLLAVAATVGTVAGAALFGGGLGPKAPTTGPTSGPSVAPTAAVAALPANGWIAFTTYAKTADQDEDIWLVSLDKPPRRVIGTDTDRVNELCPAFSPDGRRLAYGRVDDAGASVGIVDVRADGSVSDPDIVDVGPGQAAPCPTWSPDGSAIAFAVNLTSPINPDRGAAGSEVRIVTLSNHQSMTYPDLLATDLEWSPDSRTLAVASGGAALVTGEALQNGRIRLIDTDSGTIRTLDETVGAGSMTWSPDGGQIAFETSAAGGSTALLLEDLATRHVTTLDPSFYVVHGFGPMWVPRGDTILYQRGRCTICDAEGSLVTLVSAASAVDGTPAPRLIAPDGAIELTPELEASDGGGRLRPYWTTWSPDGTYILYRAWIVRAPGGPDVKLLSVLAAVPVAGGRPVTVLADALQLGIVPNDAYDSGTYVPIQAWARQPSD